MQTLPVCAPLSAPLRSSCTALLTGKGIKLGKLCPLILHLIWAQLKSSFGKSNQAVAGKWLLRGGPAQTHLLHSLPVGFITELSPLLGWVCFFSPQG